MASDPRSDEAPQEGIAAPVDTRNHAAVTRSPQIRAAQVAMDGKTEVQPAAERKVVARNTEASGTLAAPRILEADSKRNPVAKENAAGSVLSRSGVEQALPPLVYNK